MNYKTCSLFSVHLQYTWFTMEALDETWQNLQRIIRERDLELQKEHRRQEDNDKRRREFARQANEFHQWLADCRGEMMEATGSLGIKLENKLFYF
jgi:spectrin alpha